MLPHLSYGEHLMVASISVVMFVVFWSLFLKQGYGRGFAHTIPVSGIFLSSILFVLSTVMLSADLLGRTWQVLLAGAIVGTFFITLANFLMFKVRRMLRA